MGGKAKVVLVTGASGGVGEALVHSLVTKGVCVTLTGRNLTKLQSIVDQNFASSNRLFVVAGDLRKGDDIKRIFEESQLRWGRLDVLVNNAAAGMPSSLTKGAPDDWREMMEVNILGLAMAAQEALSRFNLKLGGQIINVLSTSAHRIPAGGGFYAATKFAARALTEALRQELAAAGSASRVCSISPGRIATEFFRDKNHFDHETQPKDLRGLLTPQAVASAIVQIIETPADVVINDLILRSSGQVS